MTKEASTLQFFPTGGKGMIKSNSRWLQPGIGLTVLLVLATAQSTAPVFPVRVTVKLPSDSTTKTTQVLLERDQARVWQQYLDAQSPAPDGTVTVRIQKPGVYWLLGSSETTDRIRRGACLLRVALSGAFELTRLPRTREGRKWGGSESEVCESGVIPLLPVGRWSRSAR